MRIICLCAILKRSIPRGIQFRIRTKAGSFSTKKVNEMRISIVGSGVVGGTTGIGFHKKGNDVLFYDIDRMRLAALKRQGYKVTTDIFKAISNSDTIFVCVPTPTVKMHMDFSFVKSATISIAKALRKMREYHVIVIRSTVLPSTTRRKIIPLLQKYSKLEPCRDFGVCTSPEFLREKHALHDFLNPNRIVIGELDKKSGDVLEKVYTSFNAPIIRTDLDSAEMIKYVSNLFLAAKISFFNEIYIICQELGLNADLISETVSLDARIGKYGIYGGKPFDGKCLPKDLEAFISYAKSRKINPQLLEAVYHINKKIASCDSKFKRKRAKRNRKEE